MFSGSCRIIILLELKKNSTGQIFNLKTVCFSVEYNVIGMNVYSDI